MPLLPSQPTVPANAVSNAVTANSTAHKGSGSDSNSGSTIAFPDVCKTPGPPAPFAPAPYLPAQYSENVRRANKADAAAKSGSKQAKIEVQAAIQSAADACSTIEGAPIKVVSATQAVMIGWTLQHKYNAFSVRLRVR